MGSVLGCGQESVFVVVGVMAENWHTVHQWDTASQRLCQVSLERPSDPGQLARSRVHRMFHAHAPRNLSNHCHLAARASFTHAINGTNSPKR